MQYSWLSNPFKNNRGSAGNVFACNYKSHSSREGVIGDRCLTMEFGMIILDNLHFLCKSVSIDNCPFLEMKAVIYIHILIY